MTDGISETTAGIAVDSLLAEMQSRFGDGASAGAETWIGRAAGTLDVMGGIAEYAGAMTLSTPIKAGVRVAIASRTDQRLRIASLNSCDRAHRDNGSVSQVDWPLSEMYADAACLVDHLSLRKRLREVACRKCASILAAAHAIIESGIVANLGGGLTIVVESDLPGAADAREVALVQAAVLSAIVRAFGSDAEEGRLAVVAHRAQFYGMGSPVGIATHAAPLMAAPRRLRQIGCRPFEVGEALPIPDGVVLVGIDCGKRHVAADEKYERARTAALMGAQIIRRLLSAEGSRIVWDGYLARVSITDYVDRLRDRIPTKLKGAAYLERFGPLDDPLAPIDPSVIYKVRSRAEHHIYEDDRVRQFAERLGRVARTGDESVLEEAGELMYASHWSYGQRCGLGSIETDLLVNLLRSEGSANGILGARISGQGAGGTVVALLRDAPQTFDAIGRAIRTYNERTKHTATMLTLAESSEPGVSVERHV